MVAKNIALWFRFCLQGPAVLMLDKTPAGLARDAKPVFKAARCAVFPIGGQYTL